MGCVYMITNTENGKKYIGKSINDAEKRRVSYHLKGQGNRLLAHAVKKYGRDAFTYKILHDNIIPELLDSFEIEAIKTSQYACS